MKLAIVTMLLLTLIGCSKETATDKTLKKIIIDNHLNTAFSPDLKAKPENKAIAELGGELFFSPDLSIDGSVSCASCHHPDKAGADGISLPIGIGGVDSRNIGKARIKAAEKNPEMNVVEGLIPRNTPTVFNSSLYRVNLFWDGRAQYAKNDDNEKIIKTGFGISPLVPTPYQQNSLLQTQARMPLSSFFEMKGNLEPNKNNHEIEQGIVKFLKTQKVWCDKFNGVYKQADCEKSISLENLTQALAEFQATLLFIDSPFEEYIQGNESALTEEQKRGALLFFGKIEDGGKGCSQCHSGKNFTNEKFYNLGLPASGRGSNENGWDFGRHNVDPMAPRFSFRTPDLLNVDTTAPYFHNGTALTLKDAVSFHAKDKDRFKNVHSIVLNEIDYKKINGDITAEFAADNEVQKLLPATISETENSEIVAFLTSLSDPCIADKQCMNTFKKDIIESNRPEKIMKTIYGNKKRVLDLNTVKSPDIECKSTKKTATNGKFMFSSHDKDVGLKHDRVIGLVNMGWLLDVINYGGVSVADVNYDCLDDMIFDAGENGLVYYHQNESGIFENKVLPLEMKEGQVTPLMIDVDGDYKFDLFVGTSGKSVAQIAFNFAEKNEIHYFNSLTGPVINATPADIDNDGDIDIALAFWRSFKSVQQEHLWVGDGHGNLVEYKKKLNLRTSEDNITNTEDVLIRRQHQTTLSESDLTFTPNFVDFDNDGDQDLLMASDFNRSQVLRNDAGKFVDITDKKQIDDNNGMGAAIADFSNTMKMDWYVTSIYRGKNATRTGNHLYRNSGKGEYTKDINAISFPLNEEWSWGSCAADFNNDGYVDIFYVSGFGENLSTASYEKPAQQKASEEFQQSNHEYSRSKPRMLINNKQGGFDDVSSVTGFSQAFDGRGIACFDYQQDGDIDIVVSPLEGIPRLYVNELNGSKNWLSIRLLGLPGNTEAFGAKVTLYTKNGLQYREVRFENNYLSRNPAQLHFGLDHLNEVEKIEITFPAPRLKTITLDHPGINQLHIVRESK